MRMAHLRRASKIIQFRDNHHVIDARLTGARHRTARLGEHKNMAMFTSALLSFSPVRLDKLLSLSRHPRVPPAEDVVSDDQSATQARMAKWGPSERAFVDAFDEPALVIDGNIVAIANGRARTVLGANIEGRDVRFAIRHPQALEHILRHRSSDLDVTGIGELGRSWRLVIRQLGEDSALVRMIDRSDAVSAEKMRVDFVANASHELRTPLSTVLGYAETLAEEGDLPADLRYNFGRTIRDEARRMLRIIEDLMSLSRIEADRFVAPNDTVSLDEIIEAAVANASTGRRGAKCEFAVALPAGLPPLRGDRAQLSQVFDNLLSNAIRYGCDQDDPRIDVSAERDGRWVTVTVSDHGAGIPREHLPRVTERFYRVDAGRSRESGGTGLGLAIVKHIVERHRGSLEIRSTVGLGTSVSVRLPIAA
jgi:two-component system, OmpR family, phosphate regulon sensor histidine kinase PhoR